MRPATYLRITAVLALALTALAVALNAWVDPLQFYRRANYPPLLGNQTRFLFPGIAKHYDYEAMILGTSVSRNFDLERLRKTAGLQPMNFAMEGASAREQSLLLGVALRTGRVKRVIWDINIEYLRGRPDWVSDFDGSFPSYLYDTNPWNEVPNYLLNLDTTQDSIRILLRRLGLPTYRDRDVSELSSSKKQRAHGFERVRAAFDRARTQRSALVTARPEFAPGLLRASFEANYLASIKAHPEVQFDLHFPPFSYAYHALIRTVAPEVFEDEFRFKEFVLQQCAGLSNVRVFDFQGIPEIVLDLDRYADTVHFDRPTHDSMLDAFASGQHLATPETLKRTEEFLRSVALPDWAERRERDGAPEERGR
jgi:hypothetical protein